MNSQPHAPSTLYDELCRLPEGIRGELLGGQLHTQPRPSGKHGLAELIRRIAASRRIRSTTLTTAETSPVPAG